MPEYRREAVEFAIIALLLVVAGSNVCVMGLTLYRQVKDIRAKARKVGDQRVTLDNSVVCFEKKNSELGHSEYVVA